MDMGKHRPQQYDKELWSGFFRVFVRTIEEQKEEHRRTVENNIENQGQRFKFKMVPKINCQCCRKVPEGYL